MAFRREIDHDIRLFSLKKPVDGLRVRDIRPSQKEKRGIFQGLRQRLQIPRIGQRVHADHLIVRMCFQHGSRQSS